MRKALALLLLTFIFQPAEVDARIDHNLDSSILESDYLILGRVLSDTSWAAPEGIIGRWHAVDVLIVRQCVANWKPVQEQELREVGDTIRRMKYFAENDESLTIDSIYFIPIRIKGNNYVFFKDNPLHLDVVRDTSLFTEYCFRRNPTAHLSFPIYEIQNRGKWKRTIRYTSDSVLVSISDNKHRPGMPSKDVTLFRGYDSDGKLVYRSRERKKMWAIGAKGVEWTFRNNGRICLHRNSWRSSWCN